MIAVKIWDLIYCMVLPGIICILHNSVLILASVCEREKIFIFVGFAHIIC